jgi:hypothetical protein
MHAVADLMVADIAAALTRLQHYIVRRAHRAHQHVLLDDLIDE